MGRIGDQPSVGAIGFNVCRPLMQLLLCCGEREKFSIRDGYEHTNMRISIKPPYKLSHARLRLLRMNYGVMKRKIVGHVFSFVLAYSCYALGNRHG